MIPPVTSSSIRAVESVAMPQTQGASGDNAFGKVLEAAVDRVELSRDTAQQSVQKFMTGEEGELHNTILQVQRAELEFEFALQVKNKIVQAYQEVMHMQI
jgi:flagellar hook-basal body complex protein FliE